MIVRKNRRHNKRNRKGVVQFFIVMVLRKPEVGGFESICKKNIEEWDHRIHLGKIGGGRWSCKDQRKAEVHQVTQEPACYRRYTIPKSLSGQLFYTTQGLENFEQK